MGLEFSSCCKSNSPKQPKNKKFSSGSQEILDVNSLCIKEKNGCNLQHISEREPEFDGDPSLHPTLGPLFMQRSQSEIKFNREKRKSQINLIENKIKLKRNNSCSTIYLDDSTISRPHTTNTIKCVTLAIYYHIKNEIDNNVLEIFDERRHPFSENSTCEYILVKPNHKMIYRFVKKLFFTAQLSPECAIITLVYLERLLTCAEIDIVPCTWKRIVLGAILLASKVWEDQAVWNVDFCRILKYNTVDDMNELERCFLEYIQFNINVPSSVYAKYYFDLRTLADQNGLSFSFKPLSIKRAFNLEAMSKVQPKKDLRRIVSLELISSKTRAILS